MAIFRVAPADKPGIVYWFTGNSGSGKTNLAINFQKQNKIILDADDLREVWTDLGFSKEDRFEQNLRLARLAKALMIQGFNVCVASICPYIELRKQINKILPGITWVYVSGPNSKTPTKEYPFEIGGWDER